MGAPRLLLAAVLAAAFGANAAGAQTCDRACLIKVTDTYLAALAAHDPKAAPLAGDVKFVENIKRMQPGQGLWETATRGAAPSFSIHVPDPVRQSAGWMGMMETGGKPALVAVRLQLRNGRIVEAEHVVAAIGAQNMAQLGTARPGFFTEIPQNRRKSHDELIRIGASYYDALDDNDGSLMPFAPDCQRHENGMITAGPNLPPRDPPYPDIKRDCIGQLDSQAMKYIEKIDNRRVFAADPVTGLVMGFSHFRHPMTNHPYAVILKDGSKGVRDAGSLNYQPFDLPAAHIFKIGADGRVHEIEANGFMTAFNAPTGWE